LAENIRSESKREMLTRAAVDLAHRQGYRKTTLADLAASAEVPLGNIYYYFKSKDDIGAAILSRRAEEFAQLQAQMAKMSDPLQRLIAFVEMTITNAPIVAEHGCPLGTLSGEMRKEGGALAERSTALLADPMSWMARQFAKMGRVADADDLALQLQSSLQGASLLAQSLGRADLLEREGRRLIGWLSGLEPGRGPVPVDEVSG